MMWHVSPVACGPTIRLVEITFPEEGVLILKVFVGTVFWLKYGSASRKSCAAIWVLNEGLAPGANAEAPASRVDNTIILPSIIVSAMAFTPSSVTNVAQSSTELNARPKLAK